jgi:hypothetical protein
MRRNLWFAFVAATAATTFVLPVMAQTPAPFYRGKQLTLVVGFTPGGGTDLFGRVIADGLAKHVEGKPSIIVQNMPGAGSVVASNYFSQKAPRDGSVLLVGTGQLIMRIILQLDGAKSKMSDFEAIIASPMGRITYTRSQTGITGPKDIPAQKEQLTLALPEVIGSIDAVLGLKLIEARFRAIMGYPGKNDTKLALERGEVSVDGQTTPVYLQTLSAGQKEGKVVPLFAQGMMDGTALKRDPAAPDIPTAGEAYLQIYGREPSGPAWEAYKASVRAIGNGGKILMAHADAPDRAREALSAAAVAMQNDPEFMKHAGSVLEGYGLNSGAALRTTISAIQMDDATIAWLKDVLTREFQMKFN